MYVIYNWEPFRNIKKKINVRALTDLNSRIQKMPQRALRIRSVQIPIPETISCNINALYPRLAFISDFFSKNLKTIKINKNKLKNK